MVHPILLIRHGNHPEVGRVLSGRSEIALDAVGPQAAHRFIADRGAGEPGATWIQNYMFTRARTIAGGTSEVQLNVIAKRILELPGA